MNILKKYIKENNKIEKYFYTGLHEKTIEQKYQYIKNHFQYHIMNSWNNLKSIANNVKIYNIGLSNEQQNKYFELEEIDPEYLYLNFQFTIEDFEEMTKTKIFFNGRSGGYIVIVPDYNITKRNENILEYLGVMDVLYYDNYKEYKKEQNTYNGGCYYQCFSSNYSRKEEIENAYYLLKAFDKLCDILRDELIYILDNYKIEEHEEIFTKTIKEIVL